MTREEGRLMARKKTSTKAASGRGSIEAIEKRRAARQLNALLTGGPRDNKIDGRTEKRRRRLIKELKDGRSGEALSPIEFVSHIHELMELGETTASLRKQGVKPRKVEQTSEVTDVANKAQEAYQFRPEAWKMLGIRLSESGVIEKKPAKKASKARKARKKA